MKNIPLICLIIITFTSTPLLSQGKIRGRAGGATAYKIGGSEMLPSTGYAGWYEITLDAGEYVLNCDDRLIPSVRVRDGETIWIDPSDNPVIAMEREMWTPSQKSFGQTYTANGTFFSGTWFTMFGGHTQLKLVLREGGPDGRVIGETITPGRNQGDTDIVASPPFPTTPGEIYYIEISSTEDTDWNISMPREPNAYPGGIAYFGGVPHPESDLGIAIKEIGAGPGKFASAEVGHDFIREGPGSGLCTTAGQTFVAGEYRNILSVYTNVGFDGFMENFIYTLYEGGPGGTPIASRKVRVRVDWGAPAYFGPDEVHIKPGIEYYLEFKHVDGKQFYSYLSDDVYPHGKAYRDGKEVEGFDHYFRILGEIEPGGVTYPINIEVSDVTTGTAKITWETGNPADGILYYGEDQSVGLSIPVSEHPSTKHSITLTGLKPSTVYYYRPTSFTGKKGAARAWGRIGHFTTLPEGGDSPRFDKPWTPTPVSPPGPRNVPVVNGSFEDGMKGWKVNWSVDPRNAGDYVMPKGPYGDATRGDYGYRPHSGEKMYGWSFWLADQPRIPREVWKQDIIHQRIAVVPGKKYVLKAWLLAGDRGSAWGADSRAKLLVDTGDSGALYKVETASRALSTQWFATRNKWMPISLHFTAEKEYADIGVQFLQWFTLEASHLYIDDITVEEVE